MRDTAPGVWSFGDYHMRTLRCKLIKDIIRLDYQELRRSSPIAARQAILQILKAHKGNVSQTAQVLNISRATVYKAIRKKEAGDLHDASRAPKHVHNKTNKKLEERVLEIHKQTGFGPVRIKEELEEVDDLYLSPHTIRNIIRRNKSKGKKQRSANKTERQFVDWYSAKAFEVVQIDLKYIVDQKALSMEQIHHIHTRNLPRYQWTAIDVNSRFRLMAYSYEKTWTNGLAWFLWVLSWLRSHGVTSHVVFTVDRGEEFGGKSWLKVHELKKLLSDFGCSFVQNRAGHPEENPHIERSHRTDDDEFYIPRILSIDSPKDFFFEAMNYLYYYNVHRRHSSLGRLPPYSYLSKSVTGLDDKIKFIPPIFLDYLAVQLGDWCGYHLLASHLVFYISCHSELSEESFTATVQMLRTQRFLLKDAQDAKPLGPVRKPAAPRFTPLHICVRTRHIYIIDLKNKEIL